MFLINNVKQSEVLILFLILGTVCLSIVVTKG